MGRRVQQVDRVDVHGETGVKACLAVSNLGGLTDADSRPRNRTQGWHCILSVLYRLAQGFVLFNICSRGDLTGSWDPKLETPKPSKAPVRLGMEDCPGRYGNAYEHVFPARDAIAWKSQITLKEKTIKG
jgi:hypothetical protein